MGNQNPQRSVGMPRKGNDSSRGGGGGGLSPRPAHSWPWGHTWYIYSLRGHAAYDALHKAVAALVTNV